MTKTIFGRILIVAVLVLMLVLAALPAGAARLPKPPDVTVDIHLDPADNELTFTAEGPAVDDGLMCAAGDEVARMDESRVRKFQLYVRFECELPTGSMEFVNVKLQRRLPIVAGSEIRYLIYQNWGSVYASGKGIAVLDGNHLYRLSGSWK